MDQKTPRKTSRDRVKDNHIGARLLPGDKERLGRMAASDKRTVSYFTAWLIHNALNMIENNERAKGEESK